MQTSILDTLKKKTITFIITAGFRINPQTRIWDPFDPESLVNHYAYFLPILDILFDRDSKNECESLSSLTMGPLRH